MNRVRYSYLPHQFSNPNKILKEIKEVIEQGDFTLGRPVEEFERKFSNLLGVKNSIGVASGTDALKISLRALNIGYGDEVITAANTFVSTVGAINEVGAKPVLVDCDDSYCIDVDLIEASITERTKALIPVHLTGSMPNMNRISEISKRYGLRIIEDSCQSVLASFNEKKAGTWGNAAAFSFHPLKNLNVWGDGGMMVTNDDTVANRMRLLRNNGIRNRDEVEVLGYNSRLDSIQAVVANSLLPQAVSDTEKRIANASYYDQALKIIPQVKIPDRPKPLKQVYHIYQIRVANRDQCVKYCLDRGVEVKIHYPIPLYRQKALEFLGYEKGQFPVTERHSKEVISLPVDQYITQTEQDIVIETIKEFYAIN